MLGWLLLLLVVWVALMVLGAIIEGLFWLLVIGAVLFVGTSLYAWSQRSGTRT